MRSRLLLLVCLAGSAMAAVNCKGPQLDYAPDASLAGAAGDANADTDGGGSSARDACDVPKISNSAPVGSCLFAPKFVDCTLDGAGAGCLSNGPDSCTGEEGAMCVSKCASNQYAAACGGPPAGGVQYEPVPANCEVIAITPSGKAYACCTCDSAN